MKKKLIHLLIFAGIPFLAACQGKKVSFEEIHSEQINQIEKRLEQVEKRVSQHLPPLSGDGIKTPQGPIKSLTFRIGTKDDRLRIYWADGSKSDLPCTKEQAIWACG